MTQSLKIYGFGSFFRHEMSAHDIDLLLVHDEVAPESIRFAIWCKSLIKAELPKADIVMLSEQEERDIDFLGRSKAELLGVFSDTHLSAQIQHLATRIVRLDYRYRE